MKMVITNIKTTHVHSVMQFINFRARKPSIHFQKQCRHHFPKPPHPPQPRHSLIIDIENSHRHCGRHATPRAALALLVLILFALAVVAAGGVVERVVGSWASHEHRRTDADARALVGARAVDLAHRGLADGAIWGRKSA